jgi:hypothetical protein
LTRHRPRRIVWAGDWQNYLPQLVASYRAGIAVPFCAGGSAMHTRRYAALAATVFTIVSIGQLVRAWNGWPIVIGSVDIPVGASWVAFLAALLLAALGFLAALRD